MGKRDPYILVLYTLFMISFRVTGQTVMPDHACIGQTKIYTVNAHAGSTYEWSIDGTIVQTGPSNQLIYTWTTANTYTIQVQERSSDGCIGEPRSGDVFVNDLTTPTFTLLGPFCQNSVPPPLPSTSLNGIPGTWQPETINTAAVGSWQLTFTPDPGRCASICEMIIKILSDLYIKIPDAFSPNRDGINDVWNIGNIELYPKVLISIFNRWGQSLWKSEKGYPVPWDGRSRGEDLPIDSYHYVIDLHNGSRPIIGTVTIIR